MLYLDTEVVKCLKCGKDNAFVTRADITEYGVWIAGNHNCTCFSRVQLIDNPVFDEFLELIRQVCIEHNIDDPEKYLLPDITTKLFPFACDPVDGNKISFRDGPRVCKYCGSNDFANTLSKPVYSTEVETFDVTFDSWNCKTKDARKQLIFNALTEIRNDI